MPAGMWGGEGLRGTFASGAFFKEFSSGGKLYVGGLEAATRARLSNELGVTVVVDCRGDETSGRHRQTHVMPPLPPGVQIPKQTVRRMVQRETDSCCFRARHRGVAGGRNSAYSLRQRPASVHPCVLCSGFSFFRYRRRCLESGLVVATPCGVLVFGRFGRLRGTPKKRARP